MATRKSTGGPRPTTLNRLEAALRRCFGCRVPPEPRCPAPATTEVTIDPPAGGTTRHILLHGPTTLVDRARREHAVLSISIPVRSYIPDVCVRFDREVLHLALYDDRSIITGVMRLLRNRGYEGPDFERAELGLQQFSSIALEPPVAFRQWVSCRFGWVDLDSSRTPC
jgi:hypothetical protein